MHVMTWHKMQKRSMKRKVDVLAGCTTEGGSQQQPYKGRKVVAPKEHTAATRDVRMSKQTHGALGRDLHKKQTFRKRQSLTGK